MLYNHLRMNMLSSKILKILFLFIPLSLISQPQIDRDYVLIPEGIVKDSPFLSLKNASVKMQRLNQDVFRFSNRLYDYLGKTIDVELINGKGISGSLIELTDRTITLQRKRSIISFNRQFSLTKKA